MTEELNPCPFCGGRASIGYCGDFEVLASCDAEFDCPGRDGTFAFFGKIYNKSKAAARNEVVTKWNTRAQPPEVTALVEAARAYQNAMENFAQEVRRDANKQYPWPAQDEALPALLAALVPFKEVE